MKVQGLGFRVQGLGVIPEFGSLFEVLAKGASRVYRETLTPESSQWLYLPKVTTPLQKLPTQSLSCHYLLSIYIYINPYIPPVRISSSRFVCISFSTMGVRSIPKTRALNNAL